MTLDPLDTNLPERCVPERSTGLLIGVGSVLSVAFMLRHPSVSSSALASVLDELAAKAATSRLVHGALITLMLLVLHGYVGMAGFLGWRSSRVRAGAIAYAVGVICMVGAALINGFVVSGLAERHVGGASDDSLGSLLTLCFAANQTLAKTGTLALSVAIFVWSCVLLRRDRFALAVGVLGLIVGALPIAGLFSGHLALDVHGMGLVILAQAVWSVAVAAWLFSLRAGGVSASKSTPLGVALIIVAIGGALLLSHGMGGSAHAPSTHAEHVASAASTTDAQSARPLAELDFEDVGGRIYVPAEIDGHATSAILDTGSGASLLNLALADAWQLPSSGAMDAHGSGGAPIQGKFLAHVELALGGLRQELPYAIPLDALTPLSGRRLEAILGHDFFQAHVVEIDYAKRRVRIFDAAAAPAPHAVVVPIHFVAALPHTTTVMTVGGVRFELETMIDTGAAGTELTGRFVAELPNGVTQSAKTITGLGVGGASEGRYLRPDALTIGVVSSAGASVSLTRPIVTRTETVGGQSNTDAVYDLGLGADILRRFRVTVDYPHERILLEPTDALTQPFEADKSGLRLAADGAELRTFKVIGVLPGSSASEAGVQVDDVLEAIDGALASKLALEEIRVLFRSASAKSWELTLRRADRTLKVTLAARSII